jgi:hypothetical protein
MRMRLKRRGETSDRAPLTTTKVEPQMATTLIRRTWARREREGAEGAAGMGEG